MPFELALRYSTPLTPIADLDEVLREFLRHAVRPVSARARLVGSEQQSMPLLTQVVADVGIAHQRQTCGPARHERRNVLGDEVLVRERYHRQVLADHRGHLAAAVAGRIDDVFGLDGALRGIDAPASPGESPNSGHLRMTVNGCPALPRSFGEGLRELRRIEVAVVGIPQPQANVVELQERMTRADLRGREQLEADAESAPLGSDVTKLIHPVRSVREPDAAGAVIGDVGAGLPCKALVQLRRILLELQQAPGGGEVRAIARGVPGGACGELVALDEHDIGPAEPGEVIEGAAADRSPADDHDPRVASQHFTRLPAGS
jgi:hypothetical protein